jgi:hypothetical protein
MENTSNASTEGSPVASARKDEELYTEEDVKKAE